MKEIGLQSIIESPAVPFGFLQMPEKAGQTFQEAFASKLKPYSKDSLAKMTKGHCQFDSKGLLRGSNPFVLTLLKQKNLLPNGKYIFSPQEFARAFNNNP